MGKMNIKTIQLEVSLATSYLHEPAEGSERGLLVLHGFSDNAVSVKKRLLGSEPLSRFHVVVPNGLFPSPTKKEDEYKEGYAWYFLDPQTRREMISPHFAAESLLKLISQVGLSHLKWTILGFSQGGFFAPYLAKAGLLCERIIGVGAGYRVEAYEGLSHLHVFAIHGEKDVIVPFEQAKAGFELLQKRGMGQKFYAIPDLGHTMNDVCRKIIRDLLHETAQ